MKKKILLVMLCLSFIFVTACAFSTADSGAAEAAAAPMTIDLDLSKMSGTVVYSQIYNMVYDPEPYLGKVIRVAGYYSAYEDTDRGVVYHACVIPDATACCAQGIEFIRSGEHLWPDDYPAEGMEIIVTGKLEKYYEDGYPYLHLVDSEMLVEEGTDT